MKRIRHFLFNQILYFCQPILGFAQHIDQLTEDPEVKQNLVQIYSKFLDNNQCLFKLNFKMIHRIVDKIYNE